MNKDIKLSLKMKKSHFEKLHLKVNSRVMKDELNQYLIENPIDIDCLHKDRSLYSVKNYFEVETLDRNPIKSMIILMFIVFMANFYFILV